MVAANQRRHRCPRRDVRDRLIRRLDPDSSGVRYVSVFNYYYGNAIEDGIDPLTFLGVTAAAVLLAAFGALLFERRDA